MLAKFKQIYTCIASRYNEVCDPGYDFASGAFSGGTGHFTQVVWKGSTDIGKFQEVMSFFSLRKYKNLGNSVRHKFP